MFLLTYWGSYTADPEKYPISEASVYGKREKGVKVPRFAVHLRLRCLGLRRTAKSNFSPPRTPRAPRKTWGQALFYGIFCLAFLPVPFVFPDFAILLAWDLEAEVCLESAYEQEY